MSQEPVKVVVVLEGGMVQGVYTLGVPVEYLTIDYDTDGTDDADLVTIPQDGGSGEAEATTSGWCPADTLDPAIATWAMEQD